MIRPIVKMPKITSSYTVTAVETEIPGSSTTAPHDGYFDVTFNLCFKTNGAADDVVIYLAREDVIYNDYFVYVQGTDSGDEISANLTIDGIKFDDGDKISLRCNSVTAPGGTIQNNCTNRPAWMRVVSR